MFNLLCSHWVACCGITLAALLAAAECRAQPVVSVWQDNANGQDFDCNGPLLGGMYSWPDNDNWNQDRRTGVDPCGNPFVVLEESNWTTVDYPDNGNGADHYEVVIGAPAPTEMNISPTIDKLTVEAAGVLNILNTRKLTIVAGAITNDGQINMLAAFNPDSITTDLLIEVDTLLAGSGTITMSNHGLNAIWAVGGATPRLTNGLGHTIQGTGRIGANLDLTNNSLIEAHHDGGLLRIDPANEVDNNGTLLARDGGILALQRGTFENLGSVIRADTGSTVRLEGATVVGGTLVTIGSGEIVLTSSIGNSTLSGVTNLGAIVQPSSVNAFVTGGLTNDGTWTMIAGVVNVTPLDFVGDNTVQGTGTIFMNDAFNRIETDGGTLTQASDHTLRGAGSLLNNTGSMINRGTILADLPIALTVNPIDTGSFTNEGTMRAIGTGGIRFFDGTVVNTTTIEALEGSKVTLDGTGSLQITGGTLASAGTGQIVILNNPTLTNVTTTGSVTQANSESATITGGLTNHAVWSLNAAGSVTQLTFTGDITLQGNGTIAMSNSGQNRIVTGGATLTHAAGHTIRGAGSLLNNTGSMINRGTILADQPTVLTVNPIDTGSFTNEGTMRASGAGGIRFVDGTFFNMTTIEALDGSKVTLDGGGNMQITGGTLASVGTGQIVILNDPTLTNVTTTGSVTQANSEYVTITGGLTNHAVWNVNAAASLTQLTFVGDITLAGSGTIVMSNSGQNRIVTTGATLTQAAGHTIRGAGNFLFDSGGMINLGTIIADQPTALVINPNALGFLNQGIVRVQAMSTLTVGSGDVFRQTAGLTQVDGILDAPGGVQLQGGRLAGAGTIDGLVNNSAGIVGPGASPGLLSITGSYTQGPASSLEIEIGGLLAGTQHDRLSVALSAMLDGALSVSLLDLGGGLFMPSLGNTFEVLTAAGGVLGSFASESLPALGAFLDWNVIYGTNSVLLSVAPSLLGDYNANGVVDTADYVVWRKTLRLLGAGLAADGNNNGEIDNGDYDVWRTYFGQTADGGFGATANATVPEPGTLMLIILAAAGVSPRRRWCALRVSKLMGA